jgi:hypothetical protein
MKTLGLLFAFLIFFAKAASAQSLPSAPFRGGPGDGYGYATTTPFMVGEDNAMPFSIWPTVVASNQTVSIKTSIAGEAVLISVAGQILARLSLVAGENTWQAALSPGIYFVCQRGSGRPEKLVVI